MVDKVNIIGAFAIKRIEDWVNDIHAASYPHPPQAYGLQYTYFKETLDTIEKILKEVEQEESNNEQ